ncbi:DUF2806 domain-containing protein [Undibacterium sp. TC9W]|uniref:DUF2806 domain-containing protein n=1 Tax=Undibacterium sp. TC9W TaxID=3413053 RepID=UPI003BF19C57
MDDFPGDEIESGEESNDFVPAVVDFLKTYLLHPTSAFKKNVAKAFGHLMKIPNSHIDGQSAVNKALYDARVDLIKATGKKLAKSIEVDEDLAAIASNTYAGKILRQQLNSTKVLQHAADEIEKLPPIPEGKTEADKTVEDKTVEDISDDWLNAFESEAVNMSSEHMQMHFGKILAGEIQKPGSYSIRTVKLIAQLDNRAAILFRKLCSLACTLSVPGRIIDSRVIAIGDVAQSNGLVPYGLSFDDLNVLFEYGLIIGDYNSSMPYIDTVVRDGNKCGLPFRYMNIDYALVPKPGRTWQEQIHFKVSGVALSVAGRELLDIVETEENETYSKALTAFFDQRGFELTLV